MEIIIIKYLFITTEKVIVEKKLTNTYKINTSHAVNEIFNYNSVETIKLFDLDL